MTDNMASQNIDLSSWDTLCVCVCVCVCILTHTHTERFIMFSVITNIYNKKTKRPTLMELFTATGKMKTFFLTTRDVRCVHQG